MKNQIYSETVVKIATIRSHLSFTQKTILMKYLRSLIGKEIKLAPMKAKSIYEEKVMMVSMMMQLRPV